MSVRKKIFVLLDNEITIRNFVMNNVFDDLAASHDVTFLFPAENWKRISVDLSSLPLPKTSRSLRVSIPDERIYRWRVLHMVHQTRIRFDVGYMRRRRMILQFNHWKARILFTLLALPGIFQIYKTYMWKKLEGIDCDEFRKLLRDERPDVLVHPSTFEGYFVNDFVMEGKRLGIPTLLVMNSWDNPSFKCAMAGEPDRCVVWGEQTRQHARKYMRLPSEKITVLGAAQFDIFRRAPRIDRNSFCAEHGIDPSRKIILYAGSSRGSFEYKHLAILSQAIEQGALPQACVLYRPHPWGRGGADGKRIVQEPLPHVVVERSMVSYLQQVSDGTANVSFLGSEYARTHDVLANIDILISPMSTIILEGILHGKPVMCLIPADEAKASEALSLRVNLDHFAELFRSPAMLVGHSRDSLVDLTRQLIERSDDPGFRAVLESEAKFFVEFPSKPYSAALADFVDNEICRYVDAGASAMSGGV